MVGTDGGLAAASFRERIGCYLKEQQLPQTVKVSEFRIRVNGVYMPEINVRRKNGNPNGDIELVVKDANLGWFLVDDANDTRSGLPKFIVEYRDEDAWALIPDDMRQASTDKGWNTTTAEGLIRVLWYAGVLK
jgi:hypothetical protein